MAVLECRGLTVRYGDVVALDSVDVSVAPGETVAVLGPSGSGKSTLLYAIAGFADLDAGEISVAGVEVASTRTAAPPEERAIGFVFQNYALWPHLTAEETVAYPLLRSGMGRAQAHEEAHRLLDSVGIAELARRKPAELSGGQQQRVGLARALARSAKLFLLDEPTAHLDAALRTAVQEEIATRTSAGSAGVVYATHDAVEALAAADRVVVLRQGRVVQVGSPVDIYERPVDRWTATLTGAVSVIEADLETEATRTVARFGSLRVAVHGAAPTGSHGELLIRPEWIVVGDTDAPSGVIKGEVGARWFRGPHTDYEVTTPVGVFTARVTGAPQFELGERIGLTMTRAWLPPG